VQDACSPNSSVAVPAPRGDLTTALVSQETRSLEATNHVGGVGSHEVTPRGLWSQPGPAARWASPWEESRSLFSQLRSLGQPGG
jgi:hypothetical protein